MVLGHRQTLHLDHFQIYRRNVGWADTTLGFLRAFLFPPRISVPPGDLHIQLIHFCSSTHLHIDSSISIPSRIDILTHPFPFLHAFAYKLLLFSYADLCKLTIPGIIFMISLYSWFKPFVIHVYDCESRLLCHSHELSGCLSLGRLPLLFPPPASLIDFLPFVFCHHVPCRMQPISR